MPVGRRESGNLGTWEYVGTTHILSCQDTGNQELENAGEQISKKEGTRVERER